MNGCKLTWSLFNTYIWQDLRNNSIGKHWWINPLCKINTSSKAYAAEQIDTDGDFSSTRVFPDVSFDSESSKENQLDIRYLSRNDRKQMNEWV